MSEFKLSWISNFIAEKTKWNYFVFLLTASKCTIIIFAGFVKEYIFVPQSIRPDKNRGNFCCRPGGLRRVLWQKVK